jgi:hypothetical protein
MKIVQTILKSGDTQQVAWIDNDPRVRVGVQVTLKDSDEPERLWKVTAMGAIADKTDIAGKRSGTWFNTDFVRKGNSYVSATGN